MICQYIEQQDLEAEKDGSMELTEKYIQPVLVPFGKPKPSKPAKRPPRRKKESEVSTEADLNTHIELCALRYKGIEEKFDSVEKRLDRINDDLSDIKQILDKKSSATTTAIISAGGAIIVALIGFLGYLLTHIK